jgi:hypothetical protein
MAIVKKEQVIDNWSILIKNAQGQAESIFQDTQNRITESRAPDIEMERKSLAPGIVKGLLGAKREFLIVRNKTNRNLKTYQVYVNARDYGNNLHVSWYLVTKLGFLRTLLARIFFFIAREPQPSTLVAELDLFDQQDLIAYTTNAHHCLLEAVEKLMVDLHQDPSKIDRKSRGFLGIS